jgi:CheY-like chemotaxis protein
MKNLLIQGICGSIYMERGMNILIAEDQHLIQLVLEAAMMEWGFDYDMASNGLEAVFCAKAKSGRYDICIMDVSMPVMNGIEATRVIRREVGYFPILGYSSDIALRELCLEAGMDGFLVKPCPMERMFEVINELVFSPL